MAATREPTDELSRLSISFRIAYADITLGEELGRGGFGVVKAGRWKYNQVAVKQFNLARPSHDALSEFQREAELMLQLRSPNIVRLYGICNETPYALVMEYMEGGSLYGLLQSTQPLDWQKRQRIALDISRGLAYLHSERILHLDLKSLNVMLDEHGKAKLSDFGLSKFKRETSSFATVSSGGSSRWMAPELFQRRAVATPKTDVYAYGMVLWEIASRKIPFADAASPDLIPGWVKDGEREDIPPDCPVDFAQLIRRCWEGAQDVRPNAEQVMLELERLLSRPVVVTLPSSPVPAIVPAASSAYRDNLDSMMPAVALPPVPPPEGASSAAPARILPPRPAPTAPPKATSPAGLFGRRPAVPAESPDLLRLLRLVAEGEQDQAEEMLRANPELAWGSGRVTDLSDRTFANITAFQYALWALDWHMWEMILKYLPKEIAAEQLAELEKNSTEHGTHFILKLLYDSLCAYVKDPNENEWWKIGKAQKLLPVNIVNEYCRPDRSFNPLPDFTESHLPRTRNIVISPKQDWYHTLFDTQLSLWSAIKRAGEDAASWEQLDVDHYGRVSRYTPLPTEDSINLDANAIQNLQHVCTEKLKSLQSELLRYLPDYSGPQI